MVIGIIVHTHGRFCFHLFFVPPRRVLRVEETASGENEIEYSLRCILSIPVAIAWRERDSHHPGADLKYFKKLKKAGGFFVKLLKKELTAGAFKVYWV
jgi:hypothetical protein